MTDTKLKTRCGENFATANVGRLNTLHDVTLEIPGTKKEFSGKLFLKKPLGLTGMEVSLNVLPPGGMIPFYHTHKHNEELYVFIKGRGQFQVDNEVIEIDEGTVIRVTTDGERTWRNNSDEDLYYIVIQAPEGKLESDAIEDGEGVDLLVKW